MTRSPPPRRRALPRTVALIVAALALLLAWTVLDGRVDGLPGVRRRSAGAGVTGIRPRTTCGRVPADGDLRVRRRHDRGPHRRAERRRRRRPSRSASGSSASTPPRARPLRSAGRTKPETTCARCCPRAPPCGRRPTCERRDRYDRALLYLWTDDGRFVNHELVAAGDAEAMLVEPNGAHYACSRPHEASARAAGIGQWGACG